jgi:pyruvate dehydrogenase E2 component (dihydrolipoamide acetyltransferase)
MNVLMPQLGETVAEGTITVWHKAVGDAVAPGDSLFDIETDKTTMDIPATVAGVLSEILVPAGATVPVGSVVAILSAADSATKLAPVATKAIAPNTIKAPLDPFNAVRTPEHNFGPATLPGGVKVTPVARRLAAQLGVDLGQVSGSGPRGRIVAKDVQTVSGNPAPATAFATLLPLASNSSAAHVRAFFAGVPFKEVPVDGMRRTIARRLLEAKQTIPHFYLSVNVSLDRLLIVREELNAAANGLYKLSVNDFVIKSLAMALQRVPESNAVWAEDRILQFEHSDVSVAVSVEGGLFTPVIRQAETKSLRAISSEMKQLAERARNKTLKPGEYQGGSIAISNLGMYGVRSFSAIINPPQAAILAVGAAERRPVEMADGAVRFSSVMTVTLSCDHRVIDGVLGAQLLAAFKKLIEAPLSLLALSSD